MLSLLRQSPATLLFFALSSFVTVGQAFGQFTTILNVPPDPNIPNFRSIDSHTQLNLFEGGVIGVNFRAGAPNTTSTNVELNIFGGSVDNDLVAYDGSVVNISGGTIADGFHANNRSAVNISGGEFRLNGSPIGGLDTVGDMLVVNVPTPSVLSGTLADGRPFAFDSIFVGDRFADGTLTLVAAPLPAIGPQVIILPGDSTPLGIRNGQTLVVREGGTVGDNFNAGLGSTFNLTGGAVGRNFEAVGAQVTITGGSVGDEFDVFDGSVVAISDGSVGNNLLAANGSVVNITGGSVGGEFYAFGSTVNIDGGNVNDQFEVYDGSTVNITGGSISFGFDVGHDSVANISGGTIGGLFGASHGGVANISGGSFGDNFGVHDGGVVNISGGSVGNGLISFDGSVMNVSGGTFGDGFNAFDGSVVNITGGAFDSFQARNGSEVNLFGSQFVLDGMDMTDSLTPGVAFTVQERDVTLSGLLADGSEFAFDLNLASSSQDSFELGARLTVTLVPIGLPGDTNADGTVDVNDLNNVLNNFHLGEHGGPPIPGDAFPFDGLVNIDDLNAVRNNFGRGVTPVPEPGAADLALLGALAMVLLRAARRR